MPNEKIGKLISIGTDIIECVRIAQLIEKHGEVFLQRVFTQKEILYCSSRKAATQHYAGRWAAKEAVLKVLGTGWAKGIQSKARIATEGEEDALRGRLYWSMDPGDRLVFDHIEIRPDIRRVFGTNVVVTVASNSPTEVYTEINGDSVALFIGETGNLMARDPLRMSQLVPGVYLWRYVKP